MARAMGQGWRDKESCTLRQPLRGALDRGGGLTIGLKLGAYLVTGSVGLFSDAAESVVNLVAALWALIYAARPPDGDTPSGTTKPSTSPVVFGERPRTSGSG